MAFAAIMVDIFSEDLVEYTTCWEEYFFVLPLISMIIINISLEAHKNVQNGSDTMLLYQSWQILYFYSHILLDWI